MVFPISWINTLRPNLPEMYQEALLSQPHPHPRALIPPYVQSQSGAISLLSMEIME